MAEINITITEEMKKRLTYAIMQAHRERGSLMGSWQVADDEDDDDDPYDDGLDSRESLDSNGSPHPYNSDRGHTRAYTSDPFLPVSDPGEQTSKDVPYIPSPLEGDDLYRHNALPAPAREVVQKNIKEYIRQASIDYEPKEPAAEWRTEYV